MAFLTPEQFVAERVARFRSSCKECCSTGRVAVPAPAGDFIINVACPACRHFADGAKRFALIYFQSVPPRYQGYFLRTLQPTDKVPLSVGRQEEILTMLRAEPEESYAFFGPAGTSKTTYLTALWAENMWRWIQADIKTKWFPVRMVNAKKLLDEFTDWAMHRFDAIGPESDVSPVAPPAITREKVESWTKQGIKARLFLEEIDKIGRDTEARKANLFDVVDAVYGHEGQLVLCSNLTPVQFEEQFGSVFARRIGEMCKVVNLSEKD
jgi:hypothetical protein